MARVFLSLFSFSALLAFPFGIVAYLHGSKDFSFVMVSAVFVLVICLLGLADYLFLRTISAKRQKPQRLVALSRDPRYRARSRVWPEIWMAASPLFNHSPTLVQGLFGPLKLVLSLNDWKELNEEKLIQYCLLAQKRKPARLKLNLATLQAWVDYQVKMIEHGPKWSLPAGLKYIVFIFFRKAVFHDATNRPHDIFPIDLVGSPHGYGISAAGRK